MTKKKLTKILFIGLCLSMLATSVSFATGGGSEPTRMPGEMPGSVGSSDGPSRTIVDPVAPDWDYGDDSVSSDQLPREFVDGRSQEQIDVDRILFKEYAEEISQKRFMVTHTGKVDDYVEVGITPFNEENANYIYDLLKEYEAKVIEGHQATIMPIDYEDNVVSGLSPEHMEIDNYLFVENVEEIENKGITVTHTVPYDTYVEIGIKPFNEENAEYFYSVFGVDKIKVVEGQQAELFRTSTATEEGVEIDLAADSAETPESNRDTRVYALGAIVLLGGGFVVTRKL
ncbi:hypothetical protein Amet_3940 [Alkaliphilus metalliredigens QYMF]|uniref:Uncharacterized protein n=1 Tax=Alkaliphilus metalliredigens (strain QYMF) TaxID=293826 RepID=A6TV13_ALKMQ|nr:hypothetical protein [Alkaliphilus metalliredigens]ABR50031.1 hypothetical protein Amet_3940 [Alkaliphilus metalliredigens QYMF]